MHKYIKAILLLLIYSLFIKDAMAGEMTREVDQEESIRQEDADWINDLVVKHSKRSDGVMIIFEEYMTWAKKAKFGERMPFALWEKFKNNYKNGIDNMQVEIDDTRKRLSGRNPRCIKALDEYESRYFSEVVDLYERYASEVPKFEYAANIMASYYGKFPYIECMFEKPMGEIIDSYNNKKKNS